MLKTKNFGRKSLNEIKAILSDMGLNLGMKLDFFPLAQESDEEAEKTDSPEEEQTSTDAEETTAPAVETEDKEPTEQEGEVAEEEKGDKKDQE